MISVFESVKLQKLDGNVVFVCNKGFIALNQYNSASKQYTLELLDSGSLQLSSASGIVWRSLFSSVLKTFKPIASLAGTLLPLSYLQCASLSRYALFHFALSSPVHFRLDKYCVCITIVISVRTWFTPAVSNLVFAKHCAWNHGRWGMDDSRFRNRQSVWPVHGLAGRIRRLDGLVPR